jgi:hypothetical protein
MKTIKNITALFEQTATETETKFKLLAQPITLPAGEGSIRIKWQYQFSWPAKNPLLGDVKELINTINNAKDGDAQQVLTAIKGSDPTHEVGIIRANVSTQKNRIIGKDLGEFTGWIYLFYPDTINTQAIPANQKIASGIDNRMTYLMGADGSFQKYFKEPGTGKPADDKKIAADTKPATVFTASAFLDGDGPAYKWYYNDIGLYSTYIKKVTKKIGKARVAVTTSGDIVPIFWKFISKLPDGMAKAEPGAAGQNLIYSEPLQAALINLFAKAAKFDQSNFSKVNVNELTQDLYSKMAHAVVVLGLNAGKIKLNSLEFMKDPESAEYYAPFIISDLAAGAIVDPTAATAAAAGTATAGFDGTAINNEMDLAKVMSGAFSTTYAQDKASVDSLDKVKTLFNASAKTSGWPTPDSAWNETVKTLPWKKGGTISSNPWFTRIQGLVIKTKSQKPYGSQTAAGFLAAFNASSLK